MTHTAIRGRIKKLEDSGVMRIMATVSPMRLGGFRQAFLGIGIKPRIVSMPNSCSTSTRSPTR